MRFGTEISAHPCWLVATTHFRHKQGYDWISGGPAEVHYIFYLQ